MLQKLRAELKAIQNWDKKNFPINTLTELAAISIRAERKAELIRKITEAAEQN
jgi:hypothetical protein